MAERNRGAVREMQAIMESFIAKRRCEGDGLQIAEPTICTFRSFPARRPNRDWAIVKVCAHGCCNSRKTIEDPDHLFGTNSVGGNVDQFRNCRSIAQNAGLFFEPITPPAWDEPGPDIPVDQTKHEPSDLVSICFSIFIQSRMGKTYTLIPATAYVAYQRSPLRFSGGGKKGAINRARLNPILKSTAPIQALKGRFRSGLRYRSHRTPTEMANANTCAGYPSISRIKEYASCEGGNAITRSEGM